MIEWTGLEWWSGLEWTDLHCIFACALLSPSPRTFIDCKH